MEKDRLSGPMAIVAHGGEPTIGFSAITKLRFFTALALLLAAAPASAATEQGPRPGHAPSAAADCAQTDETCLAVVRGDLDRDGIPDTATLSYHKILRFYFVTVTTHTGRHYVPMAGSYEPRTDKISLTYRSGGDVRCRNWVRGRRIFCGHAVSDMFPASALYLSHSREGDFVLFLMFSNIHRTREPGGAPRTDGEFMVVPALDGALTDDVLPKVSEIKGR